MFDFSIVTNWIHELLLSVMPEGWAIFIECIAVGVCIVALYAIRYRTDLHGTQSLWFLPVPPRSEPCR